MIETLLQMVNDIGVEPLIIALLFKQKYEVQMMLLGEFHVDKQRTHVNDAEMTLRNLLEFVQENKEFYH
jgi:hypothetical protein